jgi:hypothetical protein
MGYESPLPSVCDGTDLKKLSRHPKVMLQARFPLQTAVSTTRSHNLEPFGLNQYRQL